MAAAVAPALSDDEDARAAALEAAAALSSLYYRQFDPLPPQEPMPAEEAAMAVQHKEEDEDDFDLPLDAHSHMPSRKELLAKAKNERRRARRALLEKRKSSFRGRCRVGPPSCHENSCPCSAAADRPCCMAAPVRVCVRWLLQGCSGRVGATTRASGTCR